MDYRKFAKIVEANGFIFDRQIGDHRIFLNNKGRHISIPLKLNRMIARRLTKENNLNHNIKEAKRNKIMNDNYPLGAGNDPQAPYNEELNIDNECYISITISKPIVLSTQPNPTEERIRELVKKSINNDIRYYQEKGYNIDDIAIITE